MELTNGTENQTSSSSSSYQDEIKKQIRLSRAIARSLDSPEKTTKANRMFEKRRNRINLLEQLQNSRERLANPQGHLDIDIESATVSDDYASKSCPPSAFNSPRSNISDVESDISTCASSVPAINADLNNGDARIPKQFRNPSSDPQRHRLVYGDIVQHFARDDKLKLVNDKLTSSSGKASRMFAKQRERLERYAVDETNVRRATSPIVPFMSKLAANPTKQEIDFARYLASPHGLQLVKSPWQAALEDPLGLPDKAFANIASPRSQSPAGNTNRYLPTQPYQQRAVTINFSDDLWRGAFAGVSPAEPNRSRTPSWMTDEYSEDALPYNQLPKTFTQSNSVIVSPRSWKDFTSSSATSRPVSQATNRAHTPPPSQIYSTRTISRPVGFNPSNSPETMTPRRHPEWVSVRERRAQFAGFAQSSLDSATPRHVMYY